MSEALTAEEQAAILIAKGDAVGAIKVLSKHLIETIERLERERDQYKQIAELNAETILEMQHQRDSVHSEFVHLQNAPRSFR